MTNEEAKQWFDAVTKPGTVLYAKRGAYISGMRSLGGGAWGGARRTLVAGDEVVIAGMGCAAGSDPAPELMARSVNGESFDFQFPALGPSIGMWNAVPNPMYWSLTADPALSTTSTLT